VKKLGILVASKQGLGLFGQDSSKSARIVASRKLQQCPDRLIYKPYFFSQRTVFFSRNKSVNSIFSHGLSAKGTGVTLAASLH